MIRTAIPLSGSSNDPSFMHPVLARLVTVLDLIDDLREGPIAMWRHAAGRGYIPKWSDEAQATYDYRSTCEPVFMGLDRTVTAGASMLWADEPRMTWGAQEARFTPLWDNIDAMGSKGTVFGKRFTERVAEHGLAAILVDHTSAPDGMRVTARDEAALNLRPFWRMYARRNVRNWRFTTIDNVPRLTMLVLREFAEVDNGAYGVETVTCYRVLRVRDNVAAWELHKEQTDGAGRTTLTLTAQGVFRDRNGRTRATLPVAIAGIGGDDDATALGASVPLVGVAFANLGHWRAATNLTFNREVCAFEMLTVTGELRSDGTEDKTAAPRLKVGPLVSLHLEQGGTVAWVAPSGAGNAQLERATAEKLEAMDKQGLGFLIPHASGTPTATEVRVKARAQFATLSDVGVAVADAMNLAWEHTAWYLGVPREQAPVFALRTDFAETAMAPDVMRLYLELTEAGFPKRLVLRALQEGGRIGPDEDLDAIEAEWQGEAEAARMIREQEARQRAEEMATRMGTNTNDGTDNADDGGTA